VVSYNVEEPQVKIKVAKILKRNNSFIMRTKSSLYSIPTKKNTKNREANKTQELQLSQGKKKKKVMAKQQIKSQLKIQKQMQEFKNKVQLVLESNSGAQDVQDSNTKTEL